MSKKHKQEKIIIPKWNSQKRSESEVVTQEKDQGGSEIGPVPEAYGATYGSSF